MLTAEHTIEGGVAVVELLMEEEEREEWRRGSSSAGGLVPWRALSPEQAMPAGPEFWHPGQGL